MQYECVAFCRYVAGRRGQYFRTAENHLVESGMVEHIHRSSRGEGNIFHGIALILIQRVSERYRYCTQEQGSANEEGDP